MFLIEIVLPKHSHGTFHSCIQYSSSWFLRKLDYGRHQSGFYCMRHCQMPNNHSHGALLLQFSSVLNVMLYVGGAPIALAAVRQAGTNERASASCRQALLRRHQCSVAAIIFGPFRSICRLCQSHFSFRQSFGFSV